MHINWASLAEVAVVAAAAAVTVVLLVAFALVGLSPRVHPGNGSESAPSGLGTVMAAVCVLAAGSIVGYGLYIIIA